MADSQYHFIHSTYGGVAVVTLTAQQYLSDSQTEFAEALRAAKEAAPSGWIVVDFSDALLVTSGPIGAIVATHRQLARSGGGIVAAGGGAFTQKILKFAANIVAYYPSVKEALAAEGMPPEAGAAHAQEVRA